MAQRIEEDRLSLEEAASGRFVAEMMKMSDPSEKARHFAKLGNLVQQHIEKILGSEGALRKIAQRSHVHPNGFYRVVLMDGEQFHPRIRLHHWPQGYHTLEDIHSHNWPFESWVLKGQYLEETYGKGICSLDENYRIFNTSVAIRGANEFYLDEVGSDYFRKTSSEIRLCGSAYSRRSDILHRVRRVDEGTTTLFCTGFYESRQSLVLRKIGPSRRAVKPLSLPIELLADLLFEVYQSDALNTEPVYS